MRVLHGAAPVRGLYVGCLGDRCLVGGDEVTFNAVMAPMLMAQPGESVRYFLRHVAEGLPVHRRLGRAVRAMADPRMDRRSLSGHCEAAARLAARLSMADVVREALAHAYERWDGKGYPDGLAGEDVPIAIRVISVARDAELWARQAPTYQRLHRPPVTLGRLLSTLLA